jgi:hypothetical protein
MQLDLTDEEASALRTLLADTIEYDRYPLSPRVQMLRGILAKFAPMAPPPSPPARPPTPASRVREPATPVRQFPGPPSCSAGRQLLWPRCHFIP